MEYKDEVTLNERDSVMDLLNTEKALMKAYSEACSEGITKGYDDIMTENFYQADKDKNRVYMLLTELGYDRVDTAPEETVKKEKERFAKIKDQLY